jgi:general secretion pathway protein L
VNLKDILNTDLGTAGRWAREGLAWWLEELSGLVPAGWRPRSARPSLVAQPGGEGTFRLMQDGIPLDPMVSPSLQRRVDLVLPSNAALVRELELPLLSPKDTRHMIALDIERLSPMRAEAIFFDTEVVVRDEVRRRQSLLLGVIDRTAAIAALDQARAAGLEPAAMGVASRSGEQRHFDFMPALRHAAGVRAPGGRLPMWWAVVAGLVAVNIAALVLRDVADVSAMRQSVESQKPAVDAALRIRKRVEDENARRIALLRRRAAAEPLRIINAATLALPAGSWTQRFETNGKTARLVGYKPPAIDLVAAVRASPVFANPRSQTMDVSAPGANGAQPFDIVADVRKAPGS